MASVSRPDWELRYVQPQELHDYWPIVKPGVEAVSSVCVDGWIPEDIYSAVRTGTSTLHVAFVDRIYAGFCVLTVLQSYSQKALHIWCAFGVKGMNVVDRFEGELVKIALNAGCRKLTFLSPRKGWAKRYKAVQTVYEKELSWVADQTT